MAYSFNSTVLNPLEGSHNMTPEQQYAIQMQNWQQWQIYQQQYAQWQAQYGDQVAKLYRNSFRKYNL